MDGFSDSKEFKGMSVIEGNQEHRALYAHKLHTLWLHDPEKPEQFGYLSTYSIYYCRPLKHAYKIPENQVQPFNISTPDGEVLFAWHILPLALYTKHEALLIQDSFGLAENIEETTAFMLLATDPDSRLLINCP